VQGIVIVSAVVNGEIQTRTLKTGDSWTPGEGEPHPLPQNVIDQYELWLNQFPQENPIGPTPIPIRPVFPTGSPPNQIPPSPNSTTTGGGGEGGG
jgi:hypothetical protein